MRSYVTKCVKSTREYANESATSLAGLKMSDIVLMSKPYFDFGNTTGFNPGSLSMANEISLPAKVKPSNDIDPQSHSKAMAKIASLERTIERLNLSHASVLKDLHAEVENLQNTVSGN